MTQDLLHKALGMFAGGSRASKPRGYNLLILLLVCLMQATAFAQAASPAARGDTPRPSDQQLRAELAGLFARLPHEQTKAAAVVIDLGSRQVVFAHHADEVLMPASVEKVYTMITAIMELGPSFQFETRLATDGQHLYLIGDGDPGLGDERLAARAGEAQLAPFDRWAKQLHKRGLPGIPGDLVLDDSIFDEQRIHPGWDQDDLGYWYAAPISGLNINNNCVDITLEPSRAVGSKPGVITMPPNSVISFDMQVSIGDGEPILRNPYPGSTYKITGKVNKTWRFPPLSYPDPTMLTGSALQTVLKDHGITLAGKLVRRRVRRADGSLPVEVAVLAAHRSPLPQALSRCGKNSQNMFAECLFKRSAYAAKRRLKQPEPQGDWAGGQKLVSLRLHELGVDIRGLVVSDGSGLSRTNHTSAHQMVTALASFARHRDFPLLRDNLSVGGVDGSLRKRMKDIAGQVHAKTGTMRGVSTLAGYVFPAAADGRETSRRVASSGRHGYAFAVFFNDYPGSSRPYRRLQDELCRKLAD